MLEAHRPRTPGEMIGCASAVRAIREFLSTPRKGRGLVLLGPSGTGKSLAVSLVAKEMGYELLESNASDVRGIDGFRALIGATKQRSLFHTRKLVVVDECEAVDSQKGMAELVAQSAAPVILISTEYDSIAKMRQCDIVKFAKVRHDLFAKFLLAICKKEGIDAPVEQLGRMAGGDVRAALIDLELARDGARGTGYRDTEESIFNIIRLIFRATSLSTVQFALNASDVPPEDLLLWLAENLAEEYQHPEERARACDFLSKADIAQARIMRRQAWPLRKYVGALAAGGTALSKQSKQSERSANTRFISYRPPRFYYGRKNEKRELAQALHCSTKKLAAYERLLDQLTGGSTLPA